MARKLKAAIREQRGLTASIGIAPNKLLAKLASDFQKPDGLTLIRDSEKIAFLRPLPVRSLHGVGTVTEARLLQAGLLTVGDLQDYQGDFRALVGSWGGELKRFAFGDDNRPLELGDDIKSISSENPFLEDTDDRPTLRGCLREQAEEIAGKLTRRRLAAFTVQVKVRYGDFTTLTRQISVEEPLQEAREIYRLGCWLLDSFLDELIDRDTFAAEKAKILSQKKTLEEQRTRVMAVRADWLEPFQKWILAAKDAGETTVSGSLAQKRVLALEVFGSNLVLDGKKARGSCVKP